MISVHVLEHVGSGLAHELKRAAHGLVRREAIEGAISAKLSARRRDL